MVKLMLVQKGFRRGFASTKLPGAETDALQVAQGPFLSAIPQVAITIQLQDASGAEKSLEKLPLLSGAWPTAVSEVLTCRCLELKARSCIFIQWDSKAAV